MGLTLFFSYSKRTILDNYSEYDATLMEIDIDGQLSSFKWSPSTIPISNLLVLAKSVIRGKDDKRVFLGHHLIYYPDSCFNCEVVRPYMSCVTSDFDSLLWQVGIY